MCSEPGGRSHRTRALGVSQPGITYEPIRHTPHPTPHTPHTSHLTLHALHTPLTPRSARHAATRCSTCRTRWRWRQRSRVRTTGSIRCRARTCASTGAKRSARGRTTAVVPPRSALAGVPFSQRTRRPRSTERRRSRREGARAAPDRRCGLWVEMCLRFCSVEPYSSQLAAGMAAFYSRPPNRAGFLKTARGACRRPQANQKRLDLGSIALSP